MTPLDTLPENLVQRAVIVSSPQDAIKEYALSRKQDRHIKRYPEWDVPRTCPALAIVKARRDLRLTEEQLKDKRVEAESKRKAINEKWNDMRRKELLLRQSFVKFNKFVKENQEKRERAEQRIKEDEERQTTREHEIDDLTQKLNHMKMVRDKMHHYVQEYMKYQTYLERVVNENVEFQTITEIFHRYDTLVDAKNVLAEAQAKDLKVLEETGAELHHMTENKTQTLMRMNNKLTQLQSRYEKAKAQALKWESIVSRIKAAAAVKNTELTQVKASCWNIYQQICKRKGIAIRASREDIEQQLIQIKRTILELKRIIRTARKEAAKLEVG